MKNRVFQSRITRFFKFDKLSFSKSENLVFQIIHIKKLGFSKLKSQVFPSGKTRFFKFDKLSFSKLKN